MKTPRSRHKRRGNTGRKLGKISLNTERSISENFPSKELDVVPGHFMYNKQDDAIQQVLKLPDITVNETSERKEGYKRNLSLPPISSDTKGTTVEDRKLSGETTKLPQINNEFSFRGSASGHGGSSWLERQDVTTISWKRALHVLDDKGREPIRQKERTN